MALLDALTLCPSFGQFIPTWAWDKNVFGDPTTFAEAIRVFGGASLNGMQPPHQWDRVKDGDYPIAFIWQPGVGDRSIDMEADALGEAIDTVTSRIGSHRIKYIMLDCEKWPTGTIDERNDTIDDLDYLEGLLRDAWPDAKMIYWAHHAPTEDGWYDKVPVGVRYATGCVLYDLHDSQRTLRRIQRAREAGIMLNRPVFPWIKLSTAYPARMLGPGRMMRLRCTGKDGPGDVPGWALYLPSGGWASDDWQEALVQFAAGYAGVNLGGAVPAVE